MNNILSDSQIQKIKKIYKFEYSKLIKLSDLDIREIEKKSFKIKDNKNHLLLTEIIQDIIDFDLIFYPTNKDWKNIANVENKVFNRIDDCFYDYDIVKNNRIIFELKLPNSLPQFLLVKNNNKYFVRVLKLEKSYPNKDDFDKLKQNIFLLNRASDLNLTFKLEEQKICQVKDKFYLILIYLYEDGIVLREWLNKHKFTTYHKNKILNLFKLGRNNDFIVGNITSDDIIVISKDKTISFKLLNLGFEPQLISHLIQTKIDSIEKGLEYYQKNFKVHNLVIQKMIKDNLVSNIKI